MRAYARIVAEADAGGTRIARLRSEPPLLLRHTHTTDGVPTVYLVAGAAGPIGGDDLRLEIEVRAGATLRVRAVASSLALPDRSGAVSVSTVVATVATDATLHWLPEPLVAAAGCRHRALSDVELAPGAALLWREELICGRHGEEPGDATVAMAVRYAGRPLLRQSLTVGPSAPGWAGAGVLGGAKATGSLLWVVAGAPPGSPPGAPPGSPTVLGPTAVLVALAGPGSLITATAPDAHTLRGYLTPPEPHRSSRRHPVSSR